MDTEIARFYRLRAQLLLGQDIAGELAAGDLLAELFQHYLSPQGGDKFEKFIQENKANGFVQILASFHYYAQHETAKAIAILEQSEEVGEQVLLLTELYLLTNKIEACETLISSAKQQSQDSIIVNLAESKLNSVLNGEKLRGGLYFFEELHHQFESAQNTAQLSIFNLQLHQFEEAGVLLDNCKETSDEITIAKICYNSIKGLDTKELIESLPKTHPYAIDLSSKDELFTKLAHKYTTN